MTRSGGNGAARRAAAWAAALVLPLLLGAPALAESWRGRVAGVADGDTLTIEREVHAALGPRSRPRERVRLAGIDAPEREQPFGTSSRRLVSELTGGGAVRVREQGRDRYGRLLAEVFLADGRSLNRELVRLGAAWWFRRYAPDDGELAALEGEARTGGRGLWAHADPVPPWEWRSRKRARRASAAGTGLAAAVP